MEPHVHDADLRRIRGWADGVLERDGIYQLREPGLSHRRVSERDARPVLYTQHGTMRPATTPSAARHDRRPGPSVPAAVRCRNEHGEGRGYADDHAKRACHIPPGHLEAIAQAHG